MFLHKRKVQSSLVTFKYIVSRLPLGFKTPSAPPTIAVLWKCSGQKQADLWGAVFCCAVVNYGLACVTRSHFTRSSPYKT